LHGTIYVRIQELGFNNKPTHHETMTSRRFCRYPETTRRWRSWRRFRWYPETTRRWIETLCILCDRETSGTKSLL